MSADFNIRLGKLKTRRQGPDALLKKAIYADSLSGSGMGFDSAETEISEAYEKRSSEKATRYALGTMQEVDPAYTATSISEGDRVKNQLERGFANEISVSFEYQGSVPLNVHIKGFSDVDLLVLRADYLVYDPQGIGKQNGRYVAWTGEPPSQLLPKLRKRSEEILKIAFPQVSMDTSGAKSIALSGGSLQRKIDVVPAHWYDTEAYQRTQQKKDRGVYILEKDTNSRIENFPFLHIHEVHQKDTLTNGGVKKIIRMLKNLRADSDDYEQIKLNSYDIASLVWHFDNENLNVQSWNELSLLATTQRNLFTFLTHKQYTTNLDTPDKSRKIIDSEEKWNSLSMLYLEITNLVDQVFEEIEGRFRTANDQDLIYRKLMESHLP